MRLTAIQARILVYIWEYRGEHGFSPTVREIQAALGAANVSAVHAHIDRLIAKGAVSKIPYGMRSIMPQIPYEEVLEALEDMETKH